MVRHHHAIARLLQRFRQFAVTAGGATETMRNDGERGAARSRQHPRLDHGAICPAIGRFILRLRLGLDLGLGLGLGRQGEANQGGDQGCSTHRQGQAPDKAGRRYAFEATRVEHRHIISCKSPGPKTLSCRQSPATGWSQDEFSERSAPLAFPQGGCSGYSGDG